MKPTGAHEPAKHPKQDFQVERLAFFSDAVFAIAITLLIIELKVPEITGSSTLTSIKEQLNELKPHILSLLISFFLIAVYWIRHHFLFKHIHNYNKEIVMMNLVTLLPIIFLPFTSAFVATASAVNNFDIVVLAFRYFLINHIAVGVSMYGLYWLAIVKHKEFSFDMDRAEKLKFKVDIIFQVTAFTVCLAVSYITTNPDVFTLFIFGSVIAKWIFDRSFKRKVKRSV